MSNEEIYKAIESNKQKMKDILSNSDNFELNLEIVSLKEEINNLRKACTHVNSNFEKMTHNGKCIYCGTEVK